MSEIGYTHSMFTGNLRAYALKVDQDTKNGGNNNGMLDGCEIEQFKNLIKNDTGYEFDFSKIKQSTTKTVKIQDNKNTFLYNNSIELAKKYINNGASSKAIEALNGGNPFKALKNKTAIIPFMDEADFKSSQAEADRQETIVTQGLYKKAREQKLKAKQEYAEHTKSTLEKVWDWFAGLIK